MTKKEQSRLKILLLVLLGIVIIVLVVAMLSSRHEDGGSANKKLQGTVDVEDIPEDVLNMENTEEFSREITKEEAVNQDFDVESIPEPAVETLTTATEEFPQENTQNSIEEEPSEIDVESIPEEIDVIDEP